MVTFELHADRLAYPGRDLERIVEPGVVDLHIGRSSADTAQVLRLEVVGDTRTVGHDRVLATPARISSTDREVSPSRPR